MRGVKCSRIIHDSSTTPPRSSRGTETAVPTKAVTWVFQVISTHFSFLPPLRRVSMQAEAAPFVPREVSRVPDSAHGASTRRRHRTRNRLPKNRPSDQMDVSLGDASDSGARTSTRAPQDGNSVSGKGTPTHNNTRSGQHHRQGTDNRSNTVLSAKLDAPNQIQRNSRDSDDLKQVPRSQRSRKNFGTRLTAGDASAPSPMLGRGSNAPVSTADLDLTSRLIHSFTHKADALDCPICFNSIHPAQPIWSCSSTRSVETCCWTTFHLKCVRSWAQKSIFLF